MVFLGYACNIHFYYRQIDIFYIYYFTHVCFIIFTETEL